MREQTTSGAIIAHEPANYDRYGYTFNLNEKTYCGWQVPYGSEQFAVGRKTMANAIKGAVFLDTGVELDELLDHLNEAS